MSDSEDQDDQCMNPYKNLGFLYFLGKVELIEILNDQNLDSTGTTRILRQRLSRHLNKVRDHGSIQNLCEHWEGVAEERNNADPDTETQLDTIFPAAPASLTRTESQMPAPINFGTEVKFPIYMQTTVPVPQLPKSSIIQTAEIPEIPPCSKGLSAIPPYMPFVDRNPIRANQRPSQPTRLIISYEAEVMNTVRKWGLRFDASGNPLEFIERVVELTSCYNIPQTDILRALPELFRGTALEWLRIKGNSFSTWEDFHKAFVQQFLPARYITRLEDEIYRRRQGPREKAKEYILAMQYLIRQHPHMTVLENIDRIFDSLRPEYRYYIRRQDFKTIDELAQLAEEFESIKNDERNVRPTQHTSALIAPISSNPPAAAPYDRFTHCWNCKQMGHRKETCQRPFKLFCSFCGEDGKLSKDCQCRRNQVATIGIPFLQDLRYFMPIELNIQTYQALIDTGSTKSFIGPTLRQKFRELNLPMQELHCTVHLVNSEPVVTSEHYQITFILEGSPLTGEVTYFPALKDDMVLGMDLLMQADLQIFMGSIPVSDRKSVQHFEGEFEFSAKSHLPSYPEKRVKNFIETEQVKFNETPVSINVPPHPSQMQTNEVSEAYLQIPTADQSRTKPKRGRSPIQTFCHNPEATTNLQPPVNIQVRTAQAPEFIIRNTQSVPERNQRGNPHDIPTVRSRSPEFRRLLSPDSTSSIPYLRANTAARRPRPGSSRYEVRPSCLAVTDLLVRHHTRPPKFLAPSRKRHPSCSYLKKKPQRRKGKINYYSGYSSRKLTSRIHT